MEEEELDIVGAVKERIGIATPDDEMDDAEIGAVCRYLGLRYGGIHDMLFSSLMNWPGFYERFELWHKN